MFSAFGSLLFLFSASRHEEEEEDASRLVKTGAGRKANATPQNKHGKRRRNPLRRRLLDGTGILVSTLPVGCADGVRRVGFVGWEGLRWRR